MKNRLKPINRNHSITVPTRLLNTPLLVSEEDVNLILSLLNSGNVPNVEALFIDDTPQSIKENQIAVIPVMGGLQYRGYGWFWRMSYSDIRRYFNGVFGLFRFSVSPIIVNILDRLCRI